MITAKAYAKVNLFLNITGRDENGYHTVENVMQTVSLHDLVSVEFSESGGIVVESDDTALGGEKDITYKAALGYQEAAGFPIHAKITVEKHIPVAAGLGGGSSDAAAVLAVLEDKYKALGRERLLSISEKLGADVPFFLVGGTALCSHYGEKIERINDCPECYILIAKWGKKPSTAEMYKRLDEAGNFSGGSLEGLVAAIDKKDLAAMSHAVYNSFERVNSQNEVTELIEIMKEEGALSAHLSGSGPSVFGIFMDKEKAENCEKLLKQKNIFASLTKTVY